jgi:hypothetical protein
MTTLSSSTTLSPHPGYQHSEGYEKDLILSDQFSHKELTIDLDIDPNIDKV